MRTYGNNGYVEATVEWLETAELNGLDTVFERADCWSVPTITYTEIANPSWTPRGGEAPLVHNNDRKTNKAIGYIAVVS